MSPSLFMLGVAFVIVVVEVAEYKTGFLSKGNKSIKDRPVAWDTAAGEKLMAEAHFNVQCMDLERLNETILGSELDWVTKKARQELLNFINVYSKAGFLRTLAAGYEDDLDVQEAAVVLCSLLSIPYETLYAHGFMEREDVEDYVDLLEG